MRLALYGLAALISTWLGIRIGVVIMGANVHAVVPGQVYRSAQLSSGDLRRLIEKHGIRTVFNLRGPCPQMAWYRSQCETLEEMCIARHDIPLHSEGLPPVPEFRRLVQALGTCEYPILMHCRRGADRTGLVAVAAILLRTDATLEEARRQLSWRFGHVSLSPSGTLHLVFDMYAEWLEERSEEHSAKRFHEWVMNHYRPGHNWAEIEPLDVPEKLSSRPVAARFRVYNRSDFPWRFRTSPNAGVHLCFLMRRAGGGGAWLGGSGYFDQDLAPNESIDLTLSLPAVRKPGRYELLVDMANPGYGWFFLLGSKPFRAEFEVVAEEERLSVPGEQ